jgi:TolB-like protein
MSDGAFDDTVSAQGAPAPVAPAAPGVVIAERYTIVRMIAAGGMGEVYEAVDRELKEHIALKRIRGAGVGNPTAIERFKREIQLARKVTHPNVCRIHDLGIDRVPGAEAPELFLSMELLAGETLAARVARGKLTPAEALPIVEQLAAGLGAAHAAGIIHRDFKSANVILVGTRAVVTDFGLARVGGDQPGADQITGTGVAMIGTPAYMAPEQVVGGEVTAAADLYALGVVMYEMLTGKLPFVGDSVLSTAALRLKDDAKPTGVDARWDAVILRLMARNPEKRFASAGDAIAALAPGPRRRGLALGVGGAALAAAATAAIVMHGGGSKPHLSGTRTVAVMGFRNTTGAHDAAWISTGLAQMLGTELSSGNLHAVSSESVVRARSDLGLPDADSFAPDTLGRIHANTGADYVLVGSYVESGGKLRLDLRLQDTASGETVASVSETTSDAALVDAVPALATKLRGAIGAGSGTSGSTGVSRDPEAAKLYAEGLDRLRAFDGRGARDLLERAIAKDPQAPLPHLALSRVLAALGYDRDMLGKAGDEAHAAQLLAKDLGEDDRLEIEANYHELSGDLPAAIAAYRTLASRYPDDFDRGEELTRALFAAAKLDDAKTEIAALRARPLLADDPRLDALEAGLARRRDDRQTEGAVLDRGIPRARARGARRLLANMLIERAWITANTARDTETGTAAAREAEAIARALGDRELLADALHVEVTSDNSFAGFNDAFLKFDEIVAIEEEIGNRARAIDTQADRVFFELTAGRAEDGLRHAEHLKDLAAAAGVRVVHAQSLYTWALEERGEVTKANDAIAHTAELVKQFPDEGGDEGALRRSINDLDAGRVAAARPVFERMASDADATAMWRGNGLLIDLAYAEGRPGDALARARTLAKAVPAEAGDFHVLILTVLVRALAEDHQVDEARRVFAEIEGKVGAFSSVDLFAVDASLAKLALATASGDAAAAATAGDALAVHIQQLRKLGAIRAADEAELALAKWELGAGRASDARSRLTAIEKDARDRGAIWIADRAHKLAR